MKKMSIWQDSVKKINFPKLEENREVDVLIIGGGITGASSFYHLSNTNLKVMLVEKEKVGMSTTSRSTGKLTFMQNDLIDKIRASTSDKDAGKYLASQKEVLSLIKDIIKKENINCDLEKVSSTIYTNKENEIAKIKDLKNFFKQNNIDVTETKLSIVDSKYAIKALDTYLFNPVKFVYGLLKDKKNIYEDTPILKIEEESGYYLCYTDKHIIKTHWIIIASHYPYFNIPFLFPLKGYLEKSYLSASKYQKDKISLISYSNPFISIRTYKDYLIYLSNSHSISNDTVDKKNFLELLKKVNDLKLTPEYLWSNIDIMTNDGLPYIGSIKNKMLIATGYNTWGLLSSVLSGKILSDIILKKQNNYIEIFSPSRINVNQIIYPFANLYKNASGYIKGFKKNKQVKYSLNTMEYKGNLVKRRCPHMKCNLILNEIENTWDCPCHGSRFTIDGKCITSPSNKDINLHK